MPSAQAKSKEPGTSKRTGGGRDGYAVRQSVLDDDWEEELEDEADPLSKHLVPLTSRPLNASYMTTSRYVQATQCNTILMKLGHAACLLPHS